MWPAQRSFLIYKWFEKLGDQARCLSEYNFGRCDLKDFSSLKCVLNKLDCD